MDHKVASSTMVAQDYILGRLNPAEREEFEEHYFGCPECAEQVRLTAAFLDNTAALRNEWRPAVTPATPSLTDRVRQWLRLPTLVPAAAALALAVVSAVEYRQIQALRAPAAVATLTPLIGQVRSTGADVVKLSASPLTLIPLAIRGHHDFDTLRFDLRRAGQSAAKLSVTQSSSPNIVLRVASSDLEPGDWEVAVTGTNNQGHTRPLEVFHFRAE